jgi:hypothetical protein
MLGMIGPAAETFSDLKKPSKKITAEFSDASSLKQASQSSFTQPSNTYSESKSAASVKPVRANSSVRASVSQKEISIQKPSTARPLTSTLIDLLDDNLSDFEVDDLDDTLQKLKLEEALEQCKKDLR